MANERTIPMLPCAELDEAISFYEALGFTRTYRQMAPNPYAVVVLEDIEIHLFGMPGFDPAESYGNAGIAVPDVDALYQDFAAGLRRVYGKLPAAGIPRILRPRKKFGTVRGFSLVDVGGNWLRIWKLGDKEEDETARKTSGLAKALDVATRLGDSHGDEALALKTLENGLKRNPDASIMDVARALLYRAELALRLGDQALACSSLASVVTLDMTEDERAGIAPEFAQTSELIDERWPPNERPGGG